jgi:hypothetical protein
VEIKIYIVTGISNSGIALAVDESRVSNLSLYLKPSNLYGISTYAGDNNDGGY